LYKYTTELIFVSSVRGIDPRKSSLFVKDMELPKGKTFREAVEKLDSKEE